MTAPFWWIVAIAGAFSLARFSQAFIVLQAHEIGLGLAYLPLITSAMHIVFSASAYPCGILADHVSPRLQLGLAGLVLVGADLTLAAADTIWMVAVGATLWGLQMGVSYGLLMAAVADVAPPHLRGTAFGIYDCVIGLTTFLASAITGWVWSISGPAMTFVIAAALAAGAITMALIWPVRRNQVS